MLLLLAPLWLAACSTDTQTPAVPEFTDADLQQGRATWMRICRNCHLLGVAGAPAITDFAAWEPRLAKGKTALYQSALSGVPGEQGWRMPPRGGNTSLADAEVRRAVDFMLAAVQALHASPR